MKLNLVKLFYEIAYLTGRVEADITLSPSERETLEFLEDLFSGEPDGQRSWRRLPVNVQAEVDHRSGTDRVNVVEMSGGGCKLTTDRLLLPGQSIKLKISQPNGVQYIFFSKVLRIGVGIEGIEIAVAFIGIPLELHRSPMPKAPDWLEQISAA
jgi:hypothetical protein